MAGGKDFVFVTCMVPQDYMTKTTAPEELKATYYIALWAPDVVIEQRLRTRPRERGFTLDEAIRPHIEYNQWIGKNLESISCLSTMKRKVKKRSQ